MSSQLQLQSPKRRSWRKWIILLGVCLTIVALGYSIVHYREWADEVELREILAELERTDPGWRLIDGAAAPVKIPDAENPTVIVEAVGKLLPPKWRNTTIEAAIRKTNPKYRLPDKIHDPLRAELRPVDEAAKKARNLNQLAEKEPDVAIIRCFESPGEVFYALVVGELLSHDASLRTHEGDIEGALSNSATILITARAWSEYPTFRGFLIRDECRRLCVESLERSLAQGQASASSLPKIQQLLQTEVTTFSVVDALRAARAGQHFLISQARDGKVDPKVLQESFHWREGFLEKAGRYFRKPSLAQIELEELKFYGVAIEIGKAPMHERMRLWTTARGQQWDSAPRGMKTMVPAIGEMFQQNLLIQAELRCAIAALAAERFRLKENRWPRNQDELIECKLLGDPQLDPYTGTPLRFRHTVDGLVIHSVGLKGNYAGDAWDNVTIPRGVERCEFRLWNVNQRGQWLP